MWGLTRKQVDKAIAKDYETKGEDSEPLEVVVQATLRHVYEEGEKPCPHWHIDPGRLERVVIKFDCLLCRAELMKEAGL